MTNEQTAQLEVDKSDPRVALFLSDGLSEYDLVSMTRIIKEGHGNWYHAELLRAFYSLIQHADAENEARLVGAYPGTCAAIRAWYNGDLPVRPKAEAPA